MIVVPLNEEARSGRRVPWVTFLLALACLGVFLHTRASDVEVDANTDAKLDEAWEFYALHPYVQVDSDTADMLGAERVAATAQEFRAIEAASGSPGLPDFVVQHDQMEFDRIVEDLYATMDDHSFFQLGFFPSSLSEPDVTLVSYVLAHESWLHLIANLVLVLLAGSFLEEVWGRAIFAVFLVSSAAAAAAGYALLDPEGGALGGASGVAAALAGAFFVRFATTRIRFQYFYLPPFGGKFTARGWVALPIYGAAYFAIDHLLTYGAPGIEAPDTEFATWVHVSGLAWGVGFAAILKVLRIEQRFIHPSIEKKLVTQSNPALERALEAHEAGRGEEALELLAGEVAAHPGNRDACLAYWDVAGAVGRPAEAAAALGRVLRDEVASGQKQLAIQHWRELTQRVPDAALEASLEVRIATFLIDAGEFDPALFSLKRILDGTCGEVSASTLHRVARVAQDLDADLALRAAREALGARDLEPDARTDVERLVTQLEATRKQGAAAPAAPEPDDPNEHTGGQLFGTSLDLDAHPEDAGLEPDAADDDRESGDVLNAAPFELDDLTVPGTGDSPELPQAAVGAPSEVFAHGEVDLTDADAADEPHLVGVDTPDEPPLPDVDAPDEPPLPEAVDLEPEPGVAALDPEALASEDLPPFEPASHGASPPGEPETTQPDLEPLPEPEVVPSGHSQPGDLEPLPLPAPPPGEAGAVDPEPREPRALKRMEAIPLALNDEALVVDVGARGKATLGLERIDAVAVAGVRGLKSKPVVVIDLLTNWLADDGQPLKVVRLRSDRFDPRKLVAEAETGAEALRRFLADLLERSAALPMPDARSATGTPFQMYDGLEAYEAEVLRALRQR